MLKTPIAAGFATSLLILAPALAQEGQVSANPPSAALQQQGAPMFSGHAGFIAEQPHTSMRLSKLKGVDVIGQDHVKIGDVDELLIDRAGRLQAVVVGVGGFLGVGGKDIAIPYDQIAWNTGDVSRAAVPSASTGPANTPGAEEARTAAAERMPGSNVSESTLNAVPEGRSGTVDPATGPVTTGTTDGAPATVAVAGSGGPERAEVRLTKAEIENAPAFRYADQNSSR
jgi:sporulation protein YlmC with PRC-barrel domain